MWFGNARHCGASDVVNEVSQDHNLAVTHNIQLRGLPLSAVTVSLHYLPRYLRSTPACGKMPVIVTWSDLQRFAAMILLRNREEQQRNWIPNSGPHSFSIPLFPSFSFFSEKTSTCFCLLHLQVAMLHRQSKFNLTECCFNCKPN